MAQFLKALKVKVTLELKALLKELSQQKESCVGNTGTIDGSLL